MMSFLQEYYQVVMALHVIAVMSWMAGMLYLPRLFAYHAEAEKGSDKSETFKLMERRLLRIIINPAMIATFLFGILMLAAHPYLLHERWLHAKLGCVLMLTATHILFAKWRKTFERDENTRPAKFYRLWNEVPAALMAVIVIMVIVKPF